MRVTVLFVGLHFILTPAVILMLAPVVAGSPTATVHDARTLGLAISVIGIPPLILSVATSWFWKIARGTTGTDTGTDP